MKLDTIITGVLTLGCVSVIAGLGRVLKQEADSEEMMVDKWSWLAHGVKKGWVEQYCATHDRYTTPKEELMYEEYDDPCIPILRMKDHSYYG